MGGGVSGGGMAVGQEERSRNRVWGGINVVFLNSGVNTVACKIGTYIMAEHRLEHCWSSVVYNTVHIFDMPEPFTGFCL